MKGIILAGGSGTRLYPLTKAISKQMLPVYDRPMIYFPLTTLMQAGIRDILIITTPRDVSLFIRQLGDGSQFGVSLSYAVQLNPEGIAQAFIIGKDFIGSDSVCLVLGDNIPPSLSAASTMNDGCTLFAYRVNDPGRYGVIEFGDSGKVMSLEEKPLHPKSNYAITGIYFFDNDVVKIAESVVPSARGELEITDINKIYLDKGKLSVTVMDSSSVWMDAGTHRSLLEAAQFVASIGDDHKNKVHTPQDIGIQNGWITE